MSPPARKSPGANRGSDLRRAAGDHEQYRADRHAAQTAAKQRRVAQSIALWKKSDFTLPTRWMAQPFDIIAPRVCYGPVDERDYLQGEFLWLWQPSGYMRAIGIMPSLLAPSLAAELADAIPGALVADGRP